MNHIPSDTHLHNLKTLLLCANAFQKASEINEEEWDRYSPHDFHEKITQIFIRIKRSDAKEEICVYSRNNLFNFIKAFFQKKRNEQDLLETQKKLAGCFSQIDRSRLTVSNCKKLAHLQKMFNEALEILADQKFGQIPSNKNCLKKEQLLSHRIDWNVEAPCVSSQVKKPLVDRVAQNLLTPKKEGEQPFPLSGNVSSLNSLHESVSSQDDLKILPEKSKDSIPDRLHLSELTTGVTEDQSVNQNTAHFHNQPNLTLSETIINGFQPIVKSNEETLTTLDQEITSSNASPNQKGKSEEPEPEEIQPIIFSTGNKKSLDVVDEMVPFEHPYSSNGQKQEAVSYHIIYFNKMQVSANKGDSNSQNELGFLYERGKGVNKDLRKAFEWFQCAAEQGNKEAQFNLGRFYEYGKGGIPIDNKKALKYYEMAARAGLSDSQRIVGDFYRYGIGTEPNIDKANEWYRSYFSHPQNKAELDKDINELETFRVNIKKLYDVTKLIRLSDLKPMNQNIKSFLAGLRIDEKELNHNLCQFFELKKKVREEKSEIVSYCRNINTQIIRDYKNKLEEKIITITNKQATSYYESFQRNPNRENLSKCRAAANLALLSQRAFKGISSIVDWMDNVSINGDIPALSEELHNDLFSLTQKVFQPNYINFFKENILNDQGVFSLAQLMKLVFKNPWRLRHLAKGISELQDIFNLNLEIGKLIKQIEQRSQDFQKMSQDDQEKIGDKYREQERQDRNKIVELGHLINSSIQNYSNYEGIYVFIMDILCEAPIEAISDNMQAAQKYATRIPSRLNEFKDLFKRIAPLKEEAWGVSLRPHKEVMYILDSPPDKVRYFFEAKPEQVQEHFRVYGAKIDTVLTARHQLMQQISAYLNQKEMHAQRLHELMGIADQLDLHLSAMLVIESNPKSMQKAFEQTQFFLSQAAKIVQNQNPSIED